jgi:hypothetical protein
MSSYLNSHSKYLLAKSENKVKKVPAWILFSNKDKQGPIHTHEDAQHYYHHGNTKPWWDYYSPLRWPSLKGTEKSEASHTAVRKVAWHFLRNFHGVIMWPSNFSSGWVRARNEHITLETELKHPSSMFLIAPR